MTRRHIFLFMVFMGSLLPIPMAQEVFRLKLADCDSCSGVVEFVAWEGGKQESLLKTTMTHGFAAGQLQKPIPRGIGKVILSLKEINWEFSYADTVLPDTLIIKSKKQGQIPDLSGAPLSNQLLSVEMKVDSLYRILEDISRLLRAFNNMGTITDTLTMEFNKITMTIDDFYQSEEVQHLPGLVKEYFTASRHLIIHPGLSVEEQRQQAATMYFACFNPNSPLLINSPLYASRLQQYLNLYASMAISEPSVLTEGIDNWLGRLRDSEKHTLASAGIMQTWLRQYGFDDAIQYIDQEYLSTLCSADSDINLQQRLAVYEKVAVGKKLPDFSWTDDAGKTQSFWLQECDEVLLVFWATWCGHCKQVMPKLLAVTSKKAGLKVIAIALDSDTLAWNTDKAAFPGWEHIQASGRWEDPLAKQFGIYATPAFFLANRKKELITKTSKPEELSFGNN